MELSTSFLEESSANRRALSLGPGISYDDDFSLEAVRALERDDPLTVIDQPNSVGNGIQSVAGELGDGPTLQNPRLPTRSASAFPGSGPTAPPVIASLISPYDGYETPPYSPLPQSPALPSSDGHNITHNVSSTFR